MSDLTKEISPSRNLVIAKECHLLGSKLNIVFNADESQYNHVFICDGNNRLIKALTESQFFDQRLLSNVGKGFCPLESCHISKAISAVCSLEYLGLEERGYGRRRLTSFWTKIKKINHFYKTKKQLTQKKRNFILA